MTEEMAAGRRWQESQWVWSCTAIRWVVCLWLQDYYLVELGKKILGRTGGWGSWPLLWEHAADSGSDRPQQDPVLCVCLSGSAVVCSPSFLPSHHPFSPRGVCGVCSKEARLIDSDPQPSQALLEAGEQSPPHRQSNQPAPLAAPPPSDWHSGPRAPRRADIHLSTVGESCQKALCKEHSVWHCSLKFIKPVKSLASVAPSEKTKPARRQPA